MATRENTETHQEASATPKGHLTYEEATAYLRISRSKLYNLIGLGALTVTKLGSRCPRLRFDEVQRLAEKGVVNV